MTPRSEDSKTLTRTKSESGKMQYVSEAQVHMIWEVMNDFPDWNHLRSDIASRWDHLRSDIASRWEQVRSPHSIELVSMHPERNGRILTIVMQTRYGPVFGNTPSDHRTKALVTGLWVQANRDDLGIRDVRFIGAAVQSFRKERR